MRIIVQRVESAKVLVNQTKINSIGKGFLLYVCIEKGDSEKTISKAVEKISKLRIFEDSNQKMNLDIQQVCGEVLSISQFTLSWRGNKGHRPSFDKSEEPETAEYLFNIFCSKLNNIITTKKGSFGSDMKVESVNDGPATFILDLSL